MKKTRKENRNFDVYSAACYIKNQAIDAYFAVIETDQFITDLVSFINQTENHNKRHAIELVAALNYGHLVVESDVVSDFAPDSRSYTNGNIACAKHVLAGRVPLTVKVFEMYDESYHTLTVNLKGRH